MKGKLRYVLYWKLTQSIGLACNLLPLTGGKHVRLCLLWSLLSWFHALRVAPKTVAHEVTALCVKLIKHLTSLTKHKRLFCRSPKRGIRLHIQGDYGCLSVLI